MTKYCVYHCYVNETANDPCEEDVTGNGPFLVTWMRHGGWINVAYADLRGQQEKTEECVSVGMRRPLVFHSDVVESSA